MIHRIVARLGFWPRTIVALTLIATIVNLGVEGRAVANTSAYELYCPGSPVGNVAFNGVVTTGSLSPSAPSKGESFSITDYQTTVSIFPAIVNAAAALGNKTLNGTIDSTVKVSKAKPASSSEKESYSSKIPSDIEGALPVSAPSSAATLGPFKATSSTIAVTENTQVPMTIDVTPGATPLTLNCTTYPNNATASGLGAKKPSGSPVAPVIAKSG